MERRQSCLIFVDQVKQVGFKAGFKCGEGRRVFDCDVIPGVCSSTAERASTETCV